MTEHEWLTSAKPLKMLGWLTSQPGEREGVSDRRLRLFACACCRQSWHLLNEWSRHAVEVAERYADGKASSRDVAAMTGSIPMHYPVDLQTYARVLHPGDAITNASAAVIVHLDDDPGKLPTLANLLRSIIGNPFRPIVTERQYITHALSRAKVNYSAHAVWEASERRGRIGLEIYREAVGAMVLRQAWLTQGVAALATVAYEQRLDIACKQCEFAEAWSDGGGRWRCGHCYGTGKLSTGQLDTHNLSILADALEDAGCDNDDVLSGLRSPEPRYRGWHVLDVILGKE